MGFLLFAYRKLSLKRQINQKQYHQMLLANQQRTIQSQISAMEQAKAAMQDAWSTISSSISDSTNTIFQAKVESSNKLVRDASTTYTSAFDEARKEYGNDRSKIENNAKVMDAEKALKDAQEANGNNAKSAYLALQATQQGLIFTNQLVNSVFASADKAKLAILQSQDQRISLDMSHTESELKLLSAEYDSVEKAEGEEAKRTAPKFGLG